jgi:hypothetical protein
MRIRLKDAVLFGCFSLALAACSSVSPVPQTELNDPRFKGPHGSMVGNDEPLFTFGVDKGKRNAGSPGDGGGIGVNGFLWRAALDTLSFMPLASADPFGGVIITDWYAAPDVPGERFKATAYILGRELRADAVRVSIFHQVLKAGQWADAPVTQATQTEMEDKVLTRARELRARAFGG